ncbi:hypothetical protein CYLTODRAFT_395722 [Cylindrobasidium torrendii FP15055 ss-10]|uniref:Uncharacterized protein n=1 Tax=Cylindrobasidium torrendii FP15055 ss-10 TaxID=1314674 RepID=A0A0D7BDE1_9AGAR|nr:hypothetical protein CYLTODRAFT_395722 [Cylindrobasidium torrendii FP15055 ss-10]
MRVFFLFATILSLATVGQALSIAEWFSGSDNFWERMVKIQRNVEGYVDGQIKNISTITGAKHLGMIKDGMSEVVSRASNLRDILESHGASTDDISDHFTEALGSLFADMEVEAEVDFTRETETTEEMRHARVEHALDRIGEVIVRSCVQMNVPETEGRAHWEALRVKLQHVLLVTLKFTEEHPTFIANVCFVIAGLLLSEVLILRPILALFGFGPYGPIKGTAAAWAQRYFWGAAVEAGSWFARLQAAGMATPRVIAPIVGGVIGGIGAGFALCGRNSRG